MLLYSLEASQQSTSKDSPQYIFLYRNKKNINIFWMKKTNKKTTVSFLELW